MAISIETISRASALRAPKMIVYGPPGIGKTTLACQASHDNMDAPESVVLIPTEDGIGRLQVNHFPMVRTWNDLLLAVSLLIKSDRDYKTVVIDSLDAVEPMLFTHVCERDNKKTKEGIYSIEAYGYGKGIKTIAPDEARRLLVGLDMLREERGCAVVLVAHSHSRRIDPPDSDSFDRYEMKLVSRELVGLFVEWADAILFANYEQTIVTDDSRGKDRKRAVGEGSRVLYTEQRPAWIAKNRYGLPPKLPLSWSAFADAFAASVARTRQTQTSQPLPQSQPEIVPAS